MLDKRIVRALLPALTAATLILASCSSQSDEAAPASDPSVPTVELTAELDHLHGLHIDAAGKVLAGTHSGLFTVELSGHTVRVGDSDDDFMGLTGVPGTDTVFASGHPGKSSSAPNPLGLRSSVDGGRTWAEKSLVGEVDFHALAANGRILVGFDGTSELLVSVDEGATWDSGATIRAASLAITNVGVWAVTADGLQHSSDTARSFSTVPDAPALMMLAGAGDSLWGVDVDGNAWRSRDGLAWEKHSYVGPVEALTAANYDTAYAATTRSLYTLN